MELEKGEAGEYLLLREVKAEDSAKKTGWLLTALQIKPLPL